MTRTWVHHSFTFKARSQLVHATPRPPLTACIHVMPAQCPPECQTSHSAPGRRSASAEAARDQPPARSTTAHGTVGTFKSQAVHAHTRHWLTLQTGPSISCTYRRPRHLLQAHATPISMQGLHLQLRVRPPASKPHTLTPTYAPYTPTHPHTHSSTRTQPPSDLKRNDANAVSHCESCHKDVGVP